MLPALLDMSHAVPKPEYANQIEFIGNPIEIRLRFHRIHPGAPDQAVGEIIMHPMVVKGLARMMTNKVKDWEKEHGEIFMPDDVKLLESFFGGKLARPGKDEKTEDDAPD